MVRKQRFVARDTRRVETGGVQSYKWILIEEQEKRQPTPHKRNNAHAKEATCHRPWENGGKGGGAATTSFFRPERYIISKSEWASEAVFVGLDLWCSAVIGRYFVLFTITLDTYKSTILELALEGEIQDKIAYPTKLKIEYFMTERHQYIKKQYTPIVLSLTLLFNTAANSTFLNNVIFQHELIRLWPTPPAFLFFCFELFFSLLWKYVAWGIRIPRWIFNAASASLLQPYPHWISWLAWISRLVESLDSFNFLTISGDPWPRKTAHAKVTAPLPFGR